MNNDEIVVLFKLAESFAERTYKELFNINPDTSHYATRELLNALSQAWLTGYAYLRTDAELERSIDEVYGFFVETDY